MFTLTDFIALFSTMAGSAYGAVKMPFWPDTYAYRLVTGLQSSMAFVFAFAGVQYLDFQYTDPGLSPGVYIGSFALPVHVYLVVILTLSVMLIPGVAYILHKNSPRLLNSHAVWAGAAAFYLLLGYHTLTLSVHGVDIKALLA